MACNIEMSKIKPYVRECIGVVSAIGSYVELLGKLYIIVSITPDGYMMRECREEEVVEYMRSIKRSKKKYKSVPKFTYTIK